MFAGLAGVTPAGAPAPRLLGIQAARGVAALIVVLYHATRSLSQPQYLGHVGLGNVFGFGHAGVDFFFVLSGFIISHVHGMDIGRPDRAARYAWRRFARIYPIYWAVTALLVLRDAFAPDAAARLTPARLLESVTLLPLGGEPMIAVAWTLQHEILFYAAFCLAILNRRLGLALVAGGIVLSLVGAISPPRDWLLYFLTSGYHLEFLMGILAARIVATGRVPAPFWLMAAGLVLFGCAAVMDVRGLITVNDPSAILLYGGGGMLLIIGLAAVDQSRRARFGATAELFGAVSYVLYLVHEVPVGLVSKLSARLGLLAILPEWSIVTLQVLAALATAFAVHFVMERPLMSGLRRLERRHRARALA